jgi:pyruvate formate-lyase/glycerol dehydratase family glycyl radical enzyme
MSTRTQQLKKNVFVKSNIVARVDKGRCIPKMGHGEANAKFSLERMRLVTESYKATEGEPMVIRKAKSFASVLNNMTIRIDEGELIVGNYAPARDEINIHPEMALEHITANLEDGYKNMLTDEGRKEYRKLAEYWKGKSASDRINAVLPKRLADYASPNSAGWHGQIFNFGRSESTGVSVLLRNGLNGIIDRIKARLKEIEADEALPVEEYVEQRYTLEGMLIAAEATINFAKRYSAKAKELASAEKDEKRKQELLKIAEVCDWVPTNPARTLHEAIQTYYFAMMISKQIESTEALGGGHRVDVIFNPFYQKDKSEGRITREEAEELVECLLIKFNEWALLFPADSQQAVGGGEINDKNITIGGVTPSGEDATSEFSFIILDAAEALRLPLPSLAVRYHKNIPPDFISRAIDVVRTGIGHPAFYNDSVYVPWLQSTGYSLETARSYGLSVCVIGLIQDGENIQTQHAIAGVINLSKCLELAFYQGKDKDKYGGKQLGVKTPDLKNATSIEEIMDAYLQQVGHVCRAIGQIDNLRSLILEKYVPQVFCSILTDGCVEKGKDCLTFSKNGSNRILFTGTTNVANSLAAIKKFVFEDKSITMTELIEACRTNFEGKEDLRQALINKAPKYGNDDDYVDKLAAEVHVKSNEAAKTAKDRWGFPFYLDAGIGGGYFSASLNCGALPDGKLDGEPTADGSHSPTCGTDKLGPTAVLKSAGKIPFTYHTLLNQKFLPKFLEGEEKQKFAQYLRSWFDLGIGHIQFNVVDKTTLLDAQVHPENYADLVVRVAGYSAYFVDLTKALQDDIIRRTEQSLS